MRRARDRLKTRPFTILGAAAGLALAIILIATQHKTTIKVERLQSRVIRVEAKTPCLNLTARQCAIKLLSALPTDAQVRRADRLASALKTAGLPQLRDVVQQAKKERRRAVRKHHRRHKHSSGGSTGGSAPTNPGTGSGGSQGGSGGSGGGSQPQPPPPPKPGVTTPHVNTPPVGPAPPVDVPPIEVPIPCNTLLTNC